MDDDQRRVTQFLAQFLSDLADKLEDTGMDVEWILTQLFPRPLAQEETAAFNAGRGSVIVQIRAIRDDWARQADEASARADNHLLSRPKDRS